MQVLTMVAGHVYLAFGVGALIGLLSGWVLRGWREDDKRRAERSTSRTTRSPSRTTRSNSRPTSMADAPAAGLQAVPLPHWLASDPFVASERAVAEEESARPLNPLSGEWDADAVGPQILLIDDRMEMLGIHAAYLRQHGYRVLLAERGLEGIAFARAYRPALIVLDHSMPDVTGLEVARELKADRATAGIPIVYMTAHSYGAVGAAAMAAGCATFLPKPVQPSRLLREVEARAPRH